MIGGMLRVKARVGIERGSVIACKRQGKKKDMQIISRASMYEQKEQIKVRFVQLY